MEVKAKIRPGYQVRLGVIALALLGFAGYFFYDGAIAYPKKQQVQLAYQQLQEEYPPGRAQQEWQELATENGWPTKTPEAPMSDMSILTQYICGFICLPIGLYFAVVFVLASRRWIGVAADGLHDHRGRHATWENINSVDDSRWKTKGILWVHFTDASGKADKMLLDDWKYEQDPTRKIVERLQEARPNTVSAETETLEGGSDEPVETKTASSEA